MAWKIYYSGAVELWGKTIPQFSRGRYISGQQLPLYDVGRLFPPILDFRNHLYRCLFFFAEDGGNYQISVEGPYPSTRPETLEIALGSETPTYFVPYLVDETQPPQIVGSWSNSVSFSLEGKGAIPFWLRLSLSETATPHVGGWFVLKVGSVTASHVVYTYKGNYVVLPADLWQPLRLSMVMSEPSLPAQFHVSPSSYEVKGHLFSNLSDEILVSYPVSGEFFESSFRQRQIKVLASAIAEVWIKGDAALGVTSAHFSRRSDALARLGVPIDMLNDALVYLTTVWSSTEGDARVSFATDLVAALGDALAHLSGNYFTLRSDGKVFIGLEKAMRADSLAFIAREIWGRNCDAYVSFLTIDDILEVPYHPNRVYGFSVIEPLAHQTIMQPYVSALFYATELTGQTQIRVLEETLPNMWHPRGIVSTYPQKTTLAVRGRRIRLRNEGSNWGIVVWIIHSQV